MNLVGKRVSVVGLRRSGSAAVTLLKRRGAFVFGSDVDRKLDLSSLDIPHELGKNSERVLEADLIVISPGVPLTNPIIKAAQKRGIDVVGELELASRYIQSPIVAVTGTNGKTTTCVMIDSILKAASVDSIVAGNIYPGTPLSGVVEKISPDTVVIVEVSSFQLETIGQFRPHIGVLLNLTPDHLDRYPSMEEYIKTKARIFKNQGKDDYAVLNTGDGNVRSLYINELPRRISFSLSFDQAADVYTRDEFVWFYEERLFRLPILGLPVEDMLAAIIVAKLLGIGREMIRKGLIDFRGVPHRMENMGELYKRKFINNSMCTNPSSFVKSLETLGRDPILIIGGKSKKVGIEPIIDAAVKRTKFCIVMGEASDSIIRGLKERKYRNYYIAKSMRDAVRKALSVSSPGDTVMLSPGFASFDMFKNFEERGNAFKDEVQRLSQG